jgi:predicted DNA-binding ribbon-helix-helix protein
MPNDARDETTVRTFRLATKWDTILKEEAEKQSITVSALLNQIVRRYTVA